MSEATSGGDLSSGKTARMSLRSCGLQLSFITKLTHAAVDGLAVIYAAFRRLYPALHSI